MTLMVDTEPTSPDHILTGKLYDLYQNAKRAKETRTTQWRKNYLLAMNRWGRSSEDPRDSEIYPILRQRVAWMTDQEIRFRFNPATDNFHPFYDFQAKLGDQMEMLLETNYKVGHWYTQVAMALWDAPIYGAGILKAVWDAGRDEGLGNINVQRVDPWNFYPDPNATSMADASHLFEAHRWTADEIARRFPNVPAWKIEEAVLYGDMMDPHERPQDQRFPRYTQDGIPVNLGQGPVSVGPPGQGVSVRNVLTRGVVVYECWLHENREEERETTDPLQGETETVLYDDWRVIVFTGDIVLLDEFASDLWELNRHPYVRYVDDEIGEFWSTPLVSHLSPLQLMINQLLAQIQNNALLTGNPVFMDVEGSGIDRTPFINKPGQRLRVKSNAANNQGGMKPQWMNPPTVSPALQGQIELCISRMENIAGLSGVSKGQMPGGRQAQQTTQAVQESGFAPIRASLRLLENTLGELGELLAHFIIINYDVPRVTAIVGPEGEQTALRLAARHFYTPTASGAEPLKFSLIVDAGASNPTSRQARIAEMDALAGMKMIDRPALLQVHRIPHWQDIDQRMTQHDLMLAQAADQAKGGGGGGQPHGPGTGHEH